MEERAPAENVDGSESRRTLGVLQVALEPGDHLQALTPGRLLPCCTGVVMRQTGNPCDAAAAPPPDKLFIAGQQPLVP